MRTFAWDIGQVSPYMVPLYEEILAPFAPGMDFMKSLQVRKCSSGQLFDFCLESVALVLSGFMYKDSFIYFFF